MKKQTPRALLFLAFFLIVPLFLSAQEFWQQVNIPAKPLPEYRPAKSTGMAKGNRVRYDPTTRQEEVLLPVEGVEKATSQQQETMEGQLPLAPYPGQVQEEVAIPKKFSDLSRVTQITSYPFSTTVKLFQKYPSGKYFVCSGTLIDAKHVLTAGHCVHNEEEGGWADSVFVFPSFNAGIDPFFGGAVSRRILSWTGWTQDQAYEHDMAVVELDRPLGALTGWLGYGYENNNTFFTGNTFHNPGYPANDPYDGNYMFYWFGKYDFTLGTDILYHNNLAFGGQSGSGSYFKNVEDQRHIYGVLSHGNSQSTGHTRVTEARFTDIREEIADNTPDATDLTLMRAMAFPAELTAGQKLDSLNFYLYNLSQTAFSGEFKVDFYLSRDGLVNESDRLIGTATFNSSLSGRRLTRLRITSAPVIPADLPAGVYYLGGRVNSTDADLENNWTSRYQVAPIRVKTEQASLDVSPGSLSFLASSGSRTFAISATTTWTIAGAPSWLTLDKSSGSGNGTVQVTAQANTSTSIRNASLTISGGGLNRSVSVTQAAAVASLVVSPLSLNYPAQGGNQTLTITSNSSWTVSGAPAWLTLDKSSGSGNGTVQASAQTNSGTSVRNATLTIAGGGLSRTVTILQSGATISLSLSPAILELEAAGGSRSLSIVANTNWTLSSSAAWLSLSPASGSGNATISATAGPNSDPQERIATITLSGSGQTRTATLRQAAASASAPWTVVKTGDDHTIILPKTLISDIEGSPLAVGDYIGCFFDRSGTDVCGGFVRWAGDAVSLSVYGDDPGTAAKDGFSGGERFRFRVYRAATQTELEAQGSFAPVGGTVTHGASFAPDGISLLTALERKAAGGPSWTVVKTGDDHTIILPKTLISEIEGSPLSNGDYIGCFFQREGAEYCAGFATWAGQALSLTVYGDDPGTALKEGFSTGESFRFRVYRAGSGSELPATASFGPVGGIVTHSSSFSPDGISLVTALRAAAANHSQTIPLAEGWNTISSYIEPAESDLLELFTPIADQVDIVKDGEARTAIPSFGINDIGNWNKLSGYRVKLSKAGQLSLSGPAVDPQSSPIALKPGWQLIAYLRQSPSPVQAEFAAIADQIDLVKDNAGNSYIPAFGIDGIGQLQPGQGYKVRAVSAIELRYSPNNPAFQGETAELRSLQLPRHYQLGDAVLSGRDATLILPLEVLAGLHSGDELSLWTSGGRLLDASVFRGQSLALIARGDDPETPVVEGLQSGEKYQVRLWRAASQEEYELEPVLSQGDQRYREDEVEILASLSLKPLNQEQPKPAFRIYPNPARDQLNLDFPGLDPAGVQVRLFSSDGRVHPLYNSKNQFFQWSVDHLPAGLYFLQISTPEGVWVEKVEMNR